MSFDSFIYKFFGEGEDGLNLLQMTDRAILVYFIALSFIKIAGKRAFGAKMAFDNIISIMLGAMLSRVIVGISPFFPTVLSTLAMVILYRILATIAVKNEKVGKVLKGEPILLFRNGRVHFKNLKKCGISYSDLTEGARLEGAQTLGEVKEVFMERNGTLSIIKK